MKYFAIAPAFALVLASAPALAGDAPDDRIIVKCGTVAPKGTPWSRADETH